MAASLFSLNFVSELVVFAVFSNLYVVVIFVINIESLKIFFEE